MNNVNDLRTQRYRTWEQAKAFLDSHRDEKGILSAEDTETYERMEQEIVDLGREIDRQERLNALEHELNAPTSEPLTGKPEGAKTDMKTGRASDEYKKNFWNAMRSKYPNATIVNALQVGTDTEGGFLVPDEFERTLIQALDEENIFRRIATVIHSNSGDRKIPVVASKGSAAWVDEEGTYGESDDTFGQITLGAYKLGTLIKVSEELLNDSAFDIAGHIATRFGVRFGNAEEDAFINGTGPSANPQVTPSQPTGILTSLTASAGNTTANAQTVTFDNIYKLYYSLKSPYRRNAAFLCNETLLLQLMLLKDGNSNYIWKPGLEAGKPDTILGRPIYTSGYMPAITGNVTQDKNKKVLLFGDFSYYWIADRQNRTLKRLNELYAVTDQVGFIGTQRVDGKLILPEAVQVMALGTGSAN